VATCRTSRARMAALHVGLSVAAGIGWLLFMAAYGILRDDTDTWPEVRYFVFDSDSHVRLFRNESAWAVRRHQWMFFPSSSAEIELELLSRDPTANISAAYVWRPPWWVEGEWSRNGRVAGQSCAFGWPSPMLCAVRPMSSGYALPSPPPPSRTHALISESEWTILWGGALRNLLAAAAVALVIIWCVRTVHARVRARLRARMGRCTTCGYHLIGLPGGANCPECGSAPAQGARHP
jgi:hypothetical protein